MGLERPIGVHAPKGDDRREAEAHNAVYIRLQHPTNCLRRIIIHGTMRGAAIQTRRGEAFILGGADLHSRDHVAGSRRILLTGAILGQLDDEPRKRLVVREERAQKIR